MAIRDFGTSLLANVRERKDTQARNARNRAKKQQRKDALQGLLFKGAMSIGNAILKDKSDEFLKSEAFYKENIQFKKGYDIANEFITNEKAARNDKLGYDAYWLNVAPAGQVDAAMTEKYGSPDNYNAADWKTNRSELMKEIGASARKNHEEGLVNAQSFINKAGDGGAEFYSNFAKEARPTTITGLITNTMRSAIGGKDLNVASREITRKGYLKDAEALIAYDKAWDATGNNRVSKFIADKTQQLKGKAPVITEEYVDIKTVNPFTGESVEESKIVAKSEDRLGNISVVIPDENLAMDSNEYEIYKQFNTFVTKHSTNDAASQRVQQVGAQALTNEGTEEEQKFFNDAAKKAGEKLSGADRTRAVAARTAITHANLAGLKSIFREQYGMNEDASNRSAIAMYKNQIQNTIDRKESGELGAQPYNNAKVFGTMITMAQQQRIASNPRNFSNASIEEIADSPTAKFALFQDYRNLTDGAMLKYDELVSEINNPIVTDVHNRMKGIVEISKKYPKIADVEALEIAYNESLEDDGSLNAMNKNLEGSQNNKDDKPVVSELVPISQLVKPTAIPTSTGSSYLNPAMASMGRGYAKKAPSQLDEYNNLLALQTVAQKKKTKSDEDLASRQPQLRDKIMEPQIVSIKAISDLNKAFVDYITKYGEV